MDIEKENILYNIDPIFFKHAIACRNGEENEMNTCMAFGCECGDGWFEPLKEFASKTSVINKICEPYGIVVVCDQLKEKYGTISVYTSWENSTTKSRKPSKDSDKIVDICSKLFQDALDKLEYKCEKTCEYCGHENKYENLCCTQGYISYICRKCSIEHEDNIVKRFDKNTNTEYIPRIVNMDKGTGYDFLNPFSEEKFMYKDICYNSVFAAYYDNIIAKFENFKDIGSKYSKVFRDTRKTSSQTAYRVGNIMMSTYHIEDDYNLMKDIVKSKFLNHHYRYKDYFEYVKGKKIYFYNTIHDNFWGACLKEEDKEQEKHNYYGKILEEIFNE